MHYNIGEFSRMTSLSIKSLRLYHDKGILIPVQVDKFTGYRYYDDSNNDPNEGFVNIHHTFSKETEK